MEPPQVLEELYRQGLALDVADRSFPDPGHRRLEFYGGFNWIAIFTVSGLLFLYCCRYQFCPRWLRFYRFMYAKRLTHALDTIDEYDDLFEDSKQTMQVDPETGEHYWVHERMAAQAAQAVGGGAGGGAESKEETSEENKALATEGDVENQIESSEATPPSKRKKKARPLSPKKIMLLQRAREEAAEYAEACRRAIYVPLREEKLQIVREAFEKRMVEGGLMGWQLTVEQKNAIGPAVVDGMQLRDPRSVKFFHDMTFNDKMERGRPKEHHRPKTKEERKQRRSPSPKARDANAGSANRIVKTPAPPLPTRRSPSPPCPSSSPPRSPSPLATMSPPAAPPPAAHLSVVRSSTAPSGGLRQR